MVLCVFSACFSDFWCLVFSGLGTWLFGAVFSVLGTGFLEGGVSNAGYIFLCLMFLVLGS